MYIRKYEYMHVNTWVIAYVLIELVEDVFYTRFVGYMYIIQFNFLYSSKLNFHLFIMYLSYK